MPQCMTPFGVKKKTNCNETIPVPCGKCPNCVARRVSAWSFRLMQEDRVSTSSHFVTLTYDTKNVPITRNGFLTINKRDAQLFFKKLRKLQPAGTPAIKYFLAAEYGGKTRRPHYHIILFNAQIGTISKAWTHGSVHLGQVEGASVGYTLKYMSKKSSVPLHRNDDRETEFRLMSKGLGASYMTDEIKKWHTDHRVVDQRMYCVLPDGRKVSMPRYYKDKIYTEMQRKRVGFFTRLRMLEEQGKDVVSIQQKIASDKAAFAKMEIKSKKSDNL